MDVRIHVSVCRYPPRLGEGIRSSPVEDAGGCEVSDWGAWDRTQVRWKSSPHLLSDPKLNKRFTNTNRHPGTQQSQNVSCLRGGPLRSTLLPSPCGQDSETERVLDGYRSTEWSGEVS